MNEDLDSLYKTNLSHSHASGLQAVFDAGYSAGQRSVVVSVPMPGPEPEPELESEQVDPIP